MAIPSIKAFFQSLPGALDREAAEEVEATYQFDLSGPQGGQYVVAIENGNCVVSEGTHPDPQVTLTMAAEDCMKILNGQLSGPAVIMSGRLRISGDVGLAMQLKSLFPVIES
jgi:putative sterol carrier protein